MSNIKVIDLFAGAGGLSVGAWLADLDVAASVELDPVACDTLEMNSKYHGKVIRGDICDLDGPGLRQQAGIKRKDSLIVVGGPPCQPFSKAAYWTEEGKEAEFRRRRANGHNVKRPPAPASARPDARRSLVDEFWRVVEEADADGFVFENVASIKHPRNRPVYEGLLSKAKDAGYEVTELVANAVDYGVAQSRVRVVVLGTKKRRPEPPTPTHSILECSDTALLPAVTAGEALAGLDNDKYFEPEEVVSGRWAEHLREIPPGWNYKALTAWAGHPEPSFEAETRFWNFLLKLSPERPSWTIAASPGPWTGPFHWTARRLRTVEMATLQGFPMDYTFAGSRRDRVRQIGNAVPPPMACALVRAVAHAI